MCSTPKGGIAIRKPSLVTEGAELDSENFHAIFHASNDNVERLQQQRIRAFEAKQPQYHQQIEIDKIRCPSHILQLTRTLKKLPRHHTLKVSSHSAALIQDLAASARVLQYHTQTMQFRRQHFLYVSTSAD